MGAQRLPPDIGGPAQAIAIPLIIGGLIKDAMLVRRGTRNQCKLPKQGWGLLEFSEINSAAGRDGTDDGEVHAASTPKGGPRNAIRRIPISATSVPFTPAKTGI